jgi:integrase
LPSFGELRLDAIKRSDVVRWREACADTRENRFNRGLCVLSAMLKYAEQLGYLRKGSNPCRGLTRFKTEPKERYLSHREYRRLGVALKAAEAELPAHVAAIQLLIYTGARKSEIGDLVWQWVTPSRLMLPGSKTGAKVIWLNSQAQAIINGLPRIADCSLLFPEPIAVGTHQC